MFIAIDTEGKRISIENALDEIKYFCPICGKPLKIKAKNSLDMRTHFAHMPNALCSDEWSHDMSEWHYQWQYKFPQENREVVIENNGIKHRADICIGKTIIEFQHSKISKEEINDRNKFYINCGYQVVWIFDATDKIKNDIEESIDPTKCRNDDLCWKRKNPQFDFSVLPQTTIYLQYKITLNNQPTDILIKLERLSSKDLVFYITAPDYIFPDNFLKEYGVIDKDILSISEILQQADQRRKQEDLKKQKELNQMRKRIMLQSSKHPRNWWL